MASHNITSKQDLKDRLRDLTGYKDNEDELPEIQLKGLIDVAQMRLEVEHGTTAWYNDNAVNLALLGTTAILAKSQVENYSVSSWAIGDQRVEVQDASQEDSAQFQEYNEMVLEGVKNSTNVKTSRTDKLSNTSDYIG